MDENIEVIIVMIKNMARVHIFGLMEENILENGKMIKDMEKDNMLSVKNKVKREFGNRMNELNGLTNE
jgi:hypothetical protein